MTSLLVSALYLVLGFSLARFAASSAAAGATAAVENGRPKRPQDGLLKALILATVLIPIFVNVTPRNLAQSGIYLLILGIEGFIPFETHRFASTENLKNAALVAFKRVAFLAVKITIFAQIARWSSVSWGFQAQHVPLWIQALCGFLVLDFYQPISIFRARSGAGWDTP